MTRMNKKYIDVRLMLTALEYYHQLHKSHLVDEVSNFGIEYYNFVEERLYKITRKYNRKFERMRKRTKFYKLIKKHERENESND